jgi:hypothetical protein
MLKQQGNMLDSLRSAQAFLDHNAGQLGGAVSPVVRKQLDDVVGELAGHRAEQTGSSAEATGATQQKLAVRTTLVRDHMIPVARAAQLHLASNPELAGIRMPVGSQSVARLASIAYGMARAAEPHAALFTASGGLPADFIARLNSATDHLLESVDARKASRGRVAGANVGLKTKLARARKIVRLIDAFVRTALRDDAVALTDWTHAKRVQRTRSITLNPAAPASATPTPTTPAPAQLILTNPAPATSAPATSAQVG